MRRIFYIVQKEFRQIRRVRANFAIIFVAPFFQLLIMGSAITTEVKNVPIATLDFDHSVASREILEAVRSTTSFTYVGAVSSEREAAAVLDRGRAKLVVAIPPHFEQQMKDGEAPRVQVLVDGVDGNSAGIALGYIQATLAREQVRMARFAPLAAARAAPRASTITVIPRMWYNPDLMSKLNIVPGLVAVLLMMLTMLLTAMNIVREKEIGTLEQLMVTPIGSIQLIIGKIIPFFVLGLMQLTVGIVAAGLVFGIWMKGSIFLLYAMAAIFCLSTLGFGIFVSTIARTQQQAMFMSWFFMIFSLLLAGFFIPIENMPQAIQDITYINPLRYFIVIIREIYLKGTGFRFLWKEALAMGAIGVLALTSASLRFRKRLK